MNLTGFDYHADEPDPARGFTRTASLIRAAREEAQKDGALVFLFDNGDALQGTPFGDWAAEQTDDNHVLMQAFRELGYDAIGLGNHDFDFGLQTLNRVLDGAPCPVICSNARQLTTGAKWNDRAILKRSLLVDGVETPFRLGLLSILPPQTAQWNAHRVQDVVVFEDILEAAQKTVEALRTDGSDVIVALAHSGLGPSEPARGMENAVIPLAAIDGIDAIVAGHTHLTLPGKDHEGLDHTDATRGHVHGKPVVMPGVAGTHLGIIDLHVQKTSAGRWKVVGQQVQLLPVIAPLRDAAVSEDPGMRRLFSYGHEETRALASRPVGHNNQSLHSYFSFCAPDRGLALVASAQAAALNVHLDKDLRGLPLLSAVSPCKFGGRAGPRSYTDVPPGKVRLRNVSDLHSFPNELRAVLVTGDMVRDWLEMSAGIFNQVDAGAVRTLTDETRAGHNFDVLFGLTYRIDLSQPARFDSHGMLVNPAANRVREICCGGIPVEPTQKFVVALNSYRASGGGHFPVAHQARQIDLPTLPIRDVLRDYLSGGLPGDPMQSAPFPFSLVRLPGHASILKTGPGARAHLSELDAYDPHVLGHDPEGFLRIRLSL